MKPLFRPPSLFGLMTQSGKPVEARARQAVSGIRRLVL